MNMNIARSLIVCGTLCVLATLGISAYLIKVLSPMLTSDGHIHDNHILLVSVAGVPGAATFLVGSILLVFGLKRCIGCGDTKANEGSCEGR